MNMLGKVPKSTEFTPAYRQMYINTECLHIKCFMSYSI